MNIQTRLLHLLIITICFSFLPALAFADETDEQTEEVDRAAEYYQEALEAYSSGEFTRSAELLERAFAHDQNLVYKYNQVLAYQGAGEYEEALRVLDIYGDPMRADGRFDDITEIFEELNDAIAERDARLAEEETRRAEMEEKEEPEEIVAPPEPEGPNIVAYSLLGAGGASLAAGLLFSSGILIGDTITRLEDSRTSEGHQDIYGAGEFTRDDDMSRLRTHQTMSIIFLAGGVILGATGGTLLFLDGSGDNEEPGALTFRPTIGVDVAGASISGRF